MFSCELTKPFVPAEAGTKGQRITSSEQTAPGFPLAREQVESEAGHHRTAIGATAEPVAPLIFNGSTMKANSLAPEAASFSSTRFSNR